MGITWIDRIELTLTTADAWFDVDLSSIIPSGTAGVILHVVNKYSNFFAFGFRKNGSTDDRTFYKMTSNSHHWLTCGVDENRILELYVDDVSVYHYMDVYIVGYIDSSAVFNTNATSLSIGARGIWTDIDIGVDDSAIGIFVEIISSSNSYYGIRKNGSTDDLFATIYQQAYGIIGVDENEIFECKVGLPVSIYLTGYIKSGVTFNTNATNLSLGITGSYTDLSALPSGATGGFIEVKTTSINSYDLRKNGISYTTYYYAGNHCWAAVECDASQLIEGKIANTYTDFYLTGYTTGETNLYPNINVYNGGSSWANPTAIQYYNGSSWVEVTAIKQWDGVSWISV